MQKGRKRLEEVRQIPIKHLVDARIDGKSFDTIAEIYGFTKMVIYSYYNSYATDFDGYDPLSKERVEARLKDRTVTLPEIADSFGISPAGLRNYILDRQISARTPHVTHVRWMIQHGYSVNNIARYYGVSHCAMSSWLDRHNLEVPMNNSLKKQRADA